MDYKSLTLIRGDTKKIKIRFLKDQKECVPNFIDDGDIITFTVRDKYTEKIVLQKNISYPENIISIEHDDTSELSFRAYDFDIEYRKEDYSTVKTLVVGDLVITKEVTY